MLTCSQVNVLALRVMTTASLPLLSPLYFRSSLRSWVSHSRSYCICSIWASTRSLLVSGPSSGFASGPASLQLTERVGENKNYIRGLSDPYSGPIAQIMWDNVDLLFQSGEVVVLLVQLPGQLLTHDIRQGAGRHHGRTRAPWALVDRTHTHTY